MKFTKQTLLGEKKGNCFTACISSITEIPIEVIPHFCACKNRNWWDYFIEWTQSKNLFAAMIMPECIEGLPKGLVLIATGKTMRGIMHSVLWKDGKVIFDPHPSNEGITEPRDYIVLGQLNQESEAFKTEVD